MNNPHDYARGVLYRYFTFVFDTELCPGTPGTEWAFLTLDYLIWQSTLFPVLFLVDHFKNFFKYNVWIILRIVVS